MIEDEWHGCYRDGWQGVIVPEAFVHPAKVSRSLARRIYDHCLEEGWLKAGDHVLDPFAGIGGFALDCMRIGCHFIGVELEAKFILLAEQNIALWHRKFHRLPNWGTARILQGDSRKLLAWNFAGPKVEAVMGSPPFTGITPTQGDPNFRTSNQLQDGKEEMRVGVGSEPLDSERESGVREEASANDAVQPEGSASIISETNTRLAENGIIAPPTSCSFAERVITSGITTKDSEHQDSLSRFHEAAFDGVVSSPPYEGSLDAKGDGIDWTKAQRGGHSKESGTPRSLSRGAIPDGYGAGAENLGNFSRDSFWLAARQILEQVYFCLKPGGHAVFVTKAFIRNKKKVEFSEQWARLCEAVGFRLVHWHKAHLIEDYGTQVTTDRGDHHRQVKRASFFRRLAELKGSPPIDWEDVTCYLKPSP